MIADRPLLGIGFMLGFCVLAPLGDSFAKLLGGLVPLGQILLVRFAVQALLLAPLALRDPGRAAMSPRALRLTLVRTLLHIAAIAAFFTALRHLPLADAVAIAFVMPFIMLLLGRFVLGETVGPRRLAACTVGFAGTLLVIQPSFAAVGAVALLPVFVALAFALFMLITRQIAKEVDPIALQAISGVFATALIGAAMIVFSASGLAPFAIVTPTPGQTALLLGIGVIGSVGHLLMTWSLRYAPSATLAPMQYLEIPIATLIGWAIFGDLPNGLAAVGIAITIGSGLYIVHRERITARARAV